MSAYVDRFTESDVDIDLLPELTDQDLEELGVSSLRHRRKILRAIRDLAAPARLATPLTAVASAKEQPQQCDDAERRQLTLHAVARAAEGQQRTRDRSPLVLGHAWSPLEGAASD